MVAMILSAALVVSLARNRALARRLACTAPIISRRTRAIAAQEMARARETRILTAQERGSLCRAVIRPWSRSAETAMPL